MGLCKVREQDDTYNADKLCEKIRFNKVKRKDSLFSDIYVVGKFSSALSKRIFSRNNNDNMTVVTDLKL